MPPRRPRVRPPERDVNLRDLKYLIAVAEMRHFGRAAQACFVSQPTLSGQVKKLEDQLGVTLFERTSKSVATTPAGEEIIRHARLALEHAEAIQAIAQAHRDPLAGPLRLGVIPTLSPYLMPLVLRPLKERYPKLRVVLSEEITDVLLLRLRDHGIDAALIATPVEEADFTARALFDEPFWIAHPREHPLSEVAALTASDLARSDLLLLADGHCLADQVRSVCGSQVAARSQDANDLRASSLETLLQLVAAGFGTTLVPALAVRGSWMTELGVTARPLGLPQAHRTISLAYRRSFPRTRALEALAEVIVDHLPGTVMPPRNTPQRGLAPGPQPGAA
jgi:LysR family hydrogen peroxide-inducible transcriptional activator